MVFAPGVWTCRAHNQYGEQRRDARLSVRSRLVLQVHPQLQVSIETYDTLYIFLLRILFDKDVTKIPLDIFFPDFTDVLIALQQSRSQAD